MRSIRFLSCNTSIKSIVKSVILESDAYLIKIRWSSLNFNYLFVQQLLLNEMGINGVCFLRLRSLMQLKRAQAIIVTTSWSKISMATAFLKYYSFKPIERIHTLHLSLLQWILFASLLATLPCQYATNGNSFSKSTEVTSAWYTIYIKWIIKHLIGQSLEIYLLENTLRTI